MNQGLLRMLVTQQLTESPTSGYQLVKAIHERTGWKPSFGSIYPLLEKMQQDGFVTVHEEGRSKVYSLTAAGKQSIEEQRNQRVDTFTKITEHIRVLECLDETAPTNDILEILKRGEIPFQDLPEATAVRDELFRLLKEGKTKTKRAELRTILNRTYKELKKL
jgi:DNA-binding PadR family transcriptional regulator